MTTKANLINREKKRTPLEATKTKEDAAWATW